MKIAVVQDVVYALAHATGKTGRFTLIERWRNNERLLAPHEHPLKVSVTKRESKMIAVKFQPCPSNCVFRMKAAEEIDFLRR